MRPPRILRHHFAILITACCLLTGYPHASADVLEDIVILMDASGSLTAPGWLGTKQFVMRLNELLPERDQTRLGIVQFATGATVRYNLTDSQVVATEDSAINALAYTQGSTYTRAAVQSAIDIFDAQSIVSTPKLIILVTDGVPNPTTTQNPNPLAVALSLRDIPLIIYGHSSAFSATPYAGITADGGNIYTMPALLTTANADAAANQFLIDAAPYFAHSVPEPSSCAFLAISSILLARRRPFLPQS